MIKKILFISCFVAAPFIVTAQEIQKISAFDFLLQHEELDRNTIQLTDCAAYGVTIDFFMCSVETETGTIGSINVRLKSVPKKQLIYGLKRCASIMGVEDNSCLVTVKGMAGTTPSGDAMLKAETLEWHSEK